MSLYVLLSRTYDKLACSYYILTRYKDLESGTYDLVSHTYD